MNFFHGLRTDSFFVVKKRRLVKFRKIYLKSRKMSFLVAIGDQNSVFRKQVTTPRAREFNRIFWRRRGDDDFEGIRKQIAHFHFFYIFFKSLNQVFDFLVIQCPKRTSIYWLYRFVGNIYIRIHIASLDNYSIGGDFKIG